MNASHLACPKHHQIFPRGRRAASPPPRGHVAAQQEYAAAWYASGTEAHTGQHCREKKLLRCGWLAMISRALQEMLTRQCVSHAYHCVRVQPLRVRVRLRFILNLFGHHLFLSECIQCACVCVYIQSHSIPFHDLYCMRDAQLDGEACMRHSIICPKRPPEHSTNIRATPANAHLIAWLRPRPLSLL